MHFEPQKTSGGKKLPVPISELQDLTDQVDDGRRGGGGSQTRKGCFNSISVTFYNFLKNYKNKTLGKRFI